MAFEGLTEKLSAAFKKLRGKGRLSESDVKEAMREIRLALLEADVSYKVVKDFIKKTTERAVGADVLESLTPAQMIVKIVNEELTALMGSDNQKIHMASQPPTIVMLVGPQGAGKTTNGAKLAGLFKKQNKNPLLVACDIYRPAAIKQLQVVGGQLDIPVFEMGQTNPVDIAKAAVAHAIRHGNDMVFLDTAGRLHVDEALMDELKAIKAAVKPNEILLVVDAMTGQDAVNAAQTFNDYLDIDGVMLSIHFDADYSSMTEVEEVLCRAAVVLTMTQIPGVDCVSFYVADAPLTDIRGNIVGSMNQDSFIENPGEQINSIQCTTLKLYFANETGDGLVEETRSDVYYSSNVSMEKLIMEQLLEGPQTEGAKSAIPAGTKLINVSVVDGVCYVSLDENFKNQDYQVNEAVVIYSIVDSLTELSTISKVQISVNGDTSGTYRDNFKLSDMYDRNLDYVVSLEETGVTEEE